MDSQATFRFVCPVCSQQGELPWPAAGKKPRCPACGAVFLPPSKAHSAESHVPVVEEEPNVGASDAAGEQQPLRKPAPRTKQAEQEPAPWPLAGLLLPNAVRFLLSLSIGARWLVLSLTLLVPCELLRRVEMPAGSSPDEANIMAWLWFLGYSGLGILSAGIWIVAANGTFLAVLRDAAAGLDDVENWPDTFWLDWLGEALYLVNALFLAALPGFAITQLAGATGPWVQAAVFLLFPIFLLSMLDASSSFIPLTLTVSLSLLAGLRG